MKHPRRSRVNGRLWIPCHITVQDTSASCTMREVRDWYLADAAYPLQMRCTECGQEWSTRDSFNADWKTTTCSNCYSGAVVITQLELDYHYLNWADDYIDRYNFGQAKSEKERSLKEESTSV